MDVNLFYDNNATKQATMKLEPFEKSYYSYSGTNKYWSSEPVLIFYDGSSYSTLEAFFNKTDFEQVINAYARLFADFKALVD